MEAYARLVARMTFCGGFALRHALGERVGVPLSLARPLSARLYFFFFLFARLCFFLLLVPVMLRRLLARVGAVRRASRSRRAVLHVAHVHAGGWSLYQPALPKITSGYWNGTGMPSPCQGKA